LRTRRPEAPCKAARRRHRRCRDGVGVGEDALMIVSSDWKLRDCERAATAYVGARRPCTTLLGRRVHTWSTRNIIAQNGAQWRRRRRRGREDCVFWGYVRLEVQKRRNTPTRPMSAPGGLARRLWGYASAHVPHHNMARHRTLRRAMASASAKMPCTCISDSFRARVHSLLLCEAGSAWDPTSRLTVKCSRR